MDSPVEKRFQFGENWRSYLGWLNDRRIAEAERSLRIMFDAEELSGKRLLDIGSGSGLFSLAARRLGAVVHSFDFDSISVECTRELRRRFETEKEKWVIERGSVLDEEYLRGLGQFDYVYCWGVLHHTGAMWRALAQVIPLVAHQGQLYLAIYNDQGWISRYWLGVKRAYNRDPITRAFVTVAHAPYLLGGRWFVRALTRGVAAGRGMSLWHDMRDWLGGYPFEVAKPEAVFDFVSARGLVLRKLRTCGGRHGCNEFLFTRA